MSGVSAYKQPVSVGTTPAFRSFQEKQKAIIVEGAFRIMKPNRKTGKHKRQKGY